jgi:hypothetical protein
MFTFKQSARVAQGALLFSALLTLGAASSLSAQESAVQAPVVAASTQNAQVLPAVAPAPAASPLFAQAEARPVTLAAASEAHTASMAEGRHTIVVSTLVLVLAIVILVLLID